MKLPGVLLVNMVSGIQNEDEVGMRLNGTVFILSN